MRLLVDTNVYLELFLKRERYNIVKKFFSLALYGHNQTVVTAMSLRDIGYIAQKYIHNIDDVKRLQVKVYGMTSKVVSTSADAAIGSLYSDTKDYEDSLQIIAAEEAMCDAIVTFNKKDFVNSNTPIFTPEEMCDLLILDK